MSRILVAFDGLQYSASAQQYAVELARTGEWHLSGLFLDDPTYTGFAIYAAVTEDGVSESRLARLTRKDAELRIESSGRFQKACKEAHVSFDIHHTRKNALTELLRESLYADMLIVQSDIHFTHHKEDFPSRFLSRILSKSRCPVLLVPPVYKPVEGFLFLYDGTAASFRSIKNFAFPFQKFSRTQAQLLSVHAVAGPSHVKDHTSVSHWIHQHFSDVRMGVREGIPISEIDEFLKKDRMSYICVTGSYGRTSISRWFRESMSDHIHRHFQLPVFICHDASD